MLTDEQKERYERQLVIDEIGESGQEKLKKGKVLVIGVGGLGSPACYYLTCAGVGTVGIVDSDKVDFSNLQRQILHNTKDLNRDKVISAKEKLNLLNPDVNIITYNMRLTHENILDVIKNYDIILDCTDNFNAKFLINDACVVAEKPFVHAGVMKFSGQLMTYIPHISPCYRCVFGDIPKPGTVPTCRETGIMGAVAGTIGTLQAMEAIKFLTDIGTLLMGSMLVYNGAAAEFKKIKLPNAQKNCKVCGDNPTITKNDFNKK